MYDLKDSTVATDSSADNCVALTLADLQIGGKQWLRAIQWPGLRWVPNITWSTVSSRYHLEYLEFQISPGVPWVPDITWRPIFRLLTRPYLAVIQYTVLQYGIVIINYHFIWYYLALDLVIRVKPVWAAHDGRPRPTIVKFQAMKRHRIFFVI